MEVWDKISRQPAGPMRLTKAVCACYEAQARGRMLTSRRVGGAPTGSPRLCCVESGSSHLPAAVGALAPRDASFQLRVSGPAAGHAGDIHPGLARSRTGGRDPPQLKNRPTRTIAPTWCHDLRTETNGNRPDDRLAPAATTSSTDAALWPGLRTASPPAAMPAGPGPHRGI